MGRPLPRFQVRMQRKYTVHFDKLWRVLRNGDELVVATHDEHIARRIAAALNNQTTRPGTMLFTKEQFRKLQEEPPRSARKPPPAEN